MIGRKAAVAGFAVVAVAPFGASAQLSTYATKTIAGQPLVAPSGAMEVHLTHDEVPAGKAIDMHMHFWPRYVFVESGEVQVTLLDTGLTQTFKAGQTIVEPLQKWHSGLVTKTAVLIAVEQTPPGGCNTIKPPAPGKPPVPGTKPAKVVPNDECPRS